jgi:hypothetical protein
LAGHGIGGTASGVVGSGAATTASAIGAVVGAHWASQGVQYRPASDGDGDLSTCPWVSYSGEWCDGNREGVGAARFAGGPTYSGAWRFDQPWGEGTWTEGEVSGSLYEGEFQQGRRHGEGAEEMPAPSRAGGSASGGGGGVGGGDAGQGAACRFRREGRWERGSAVAGEWRLTWTDGNPTSRPSDIQSAAAGPATIAEAYRGCRSYVGLASAGGLPHGVGTMKYQSSGAVYRCSAHYARGAHFLSVLSFFLFRPATRALGERLGVRRSAENGQFASLLIDLKLFFVFSLRVFSTLLTLDE